MRMVLALAALWLPVSLSSEELDLPEGYVPDPKMPGAAIGLSANRKYFKAVDRLRDEYRIQMARALEHADGASIFLLHYKPVDPRDIPKEKRKPRYFSMAPYRLHTEVLNWIELRGEGIRRIREATLELLRQPKTEGPWAHFPTHGIRLYRGEELVFETSMSLHTGNYFVRYPDNYEKGSWVGFGGKDPLKIEKELKELLPIPKELLEKFEEENG